jgi:hypothetical protein
MPNGWLLFGFLICGIKILTIEKPSHWSPFDLTSKSDQWSGDRIRYIQQKALLIKINLIKYKHI